MHENICKYVLTYLKTYQNLLKYLKIREKYNRTDAIQAAKSFITLGSSLILVQGGLSHNRHPVTPQML